MRLRHRPSKHTYIMSARINGRSVVVVKSATSEASARIAGAKELSEKYDRTILPFEMEVE